MIHAFSLLILTFALQDAETDGLYKFAKGTVWTYETIEGGTKSLMTLTSKGEEEGRTVVESVQVKEGRDPDSDTLYWEIRDGILVWSEKRSDGKRIDLFSLYKVGAKKGDTWKSGGPGMKDGPGFTATYHGETELKTPYQTFKEARYVQLSMSDPNMSMTIDFHLVPGFGLVKMIGSMTRKGKKVGMFNMSLKGFKPAK